MAWTVAQIDKYNVGPKRVHVLSLTADAATFNVVTGLDIIDHFTRGQVSVTAGTDQVMSVNCGAEGTSIAGVLGASGFTSGDVLFVTVYGR